MPDTKITKTINGWIDDDNPNVFYPFRRLAREARRLARGAVTQGRRPRPVISNPNPQPWPQPTAQPRPQSVTPNALMTLTGLQTRLYNRLTQQQGVSDADATEVILANGYNKAASYGYMRVAGATHDEAKAVIAYESPTVSLAYGLNRANGMDHSDAFDDAYQSNIGAPTTVDTLTIFIQ